MKCQRRNINWSRRGILSLTSDRCHRLWCYECRAARSVDEVIAHGVAQMQAEPVSADGMSQMLRMVGMHRAEEAPALSSPRRTHALVARRGMSILVVASVVTLALLTAFLNNRRQGGGVVLAEALEALKEVQSFHIEEALGYSYSVVGHKVTSLSTSRASAWFSIDHGLRFVKGNGDVILITKEQWLEFNKARNRWVRRNWKSREERVKVRERWVRVPSKMTPPPDPTAIARLQLGEERLKSLSKLYGRRLAPVMTLENYRGRKARYLVTEFERRQWTPKTREEFWIDQETDLILAKATWIEDADGQMRKVGGFDEIEYNVEVDPRLFAPPPGATVVDE